MYFVYLVFWLKEMPHSKPQHASTLHEGRQDNKKSIILYDLGILGREKHYRVRKQRNQGNHLSGE